MSEQLEPKIIKDIQKTGFPTEIVSASIMRHRGWKVINNTSYWDENEGKSREFDILAYNDVILQNQNIAVRINLICECKKSEKPWVFFMTEEKYDSSKLSELIKSNEIKKQLSDISYIDIIADINMLKLHHYRKFSYLARTFYELFKGKENADHSTIIYSAIMSSIKSTLYLREYFSENKNFVIFYPVIIFNGNLFEAYVSSDKSVDLKSSKHIQLSFRYIVGKSVNKSVYEKNENHQQFIIDVVHDQYIDDFLQLIEDEQQEMAKLLVF